MQTVGRIINVILGVKGLGLSLYQPPPLDYVTYA